MENHKKNQIEILSFFKFSFTADPLFIFINWNNTVNIAFFLDKISKN